MWYPFYYSAKIDENTPRLAVWLMILLQLPAIAACYSIIWFFPAILLGWFNWTSWWVGFIALLALCVLPTVAPMFSKK